MSKLQIQQTISEFDKLRDKVRTLIIDYLCECNRVFSEDDKIWLSFSEFESIQIIEINGKEGTIQSTEGVDYSFYDLNTDILIDLYNLMCEYF